MTDSHPIHHLDLRAPEPVIPGGATTMVVFWWGDLPLGARLYGADELPLSPGSLTVLAAEFLAEQASTRGWGYVERLLPARLEAEIPAADPGAPAPGSDLSTTVIICTRDRPDELNTCLTSLRQQARKPDEVFVVDNSHSGSARRVCDGHPAVTYVYEPRSGLSVARNAGVLAARGDVIAFIDDDVRPHPAWLAEICCAFATHDVEAVTGLVLPASLDTPAERFFEFEYQGFGRGYLPRLFGPSWMAEQGQQVAPTWRIGAGANMAFRRVVFARIGLFDVRLGAGASGCSEDSEYWHRLLARGGSCLYEPRAAVDHRHRADWAALSRQISSYMRGHVSALVAQYDLHGDRANLGRIWRVLPLYFGNNARRCILRLRGRSARILAAEVTGWLCGLHYFFRPGWRKLTVKKQRNLFSRPVGDDIGKRA